MAIKVTIHYRNDPSVELEAEREVQTRIEGAAVVVYHRPGALVPLCVVPLDTLLTLNVEHPSAGG